MDNSAFCLSYAEGMVGGRGRGWSISEASTVLVRLRLALGRGVSEAADSMPRRVSRRWRVDLRLASLSIVVIVGGTEAEESRAGVAGGSGLITVRFTAADVSVSRESSSAAEMADALRVRVRGTEEAVLGARLPRPLVDAPRGGRPLRGFAFGGGSNGGGRTSVADVKLLPGAIVPMRLGLEDPKVGDGAFSLRGLISSARGWMGDLGDPRPPGKSVSFHLVEATDVLIGEGFGGIFFLSGTEIGVCWLRACKGGYGAYDGVTGCGG